jgi:pyruvate-formate lyase-activating enzyme
MTIAQWFNSDPMKSARLSMFGTQPNSFCSRCYHEETVSNTSRRHRCNQKSVIFTKTSFDESYLQSPGIKKFQESQQTMGITTGMPIDVHIDLGNYCNLACKMCNPRASSTIAAQYIKWGINDANQYVGTDWTRDHEVWQRVLGELSNISSLRNVHFMGGETLLTNRFEDFLDYMLATNRTDLNLSFVTNGTVWKPSVMEKLNKFQRIGIEVSVETMTGHNEYQRQGTSNTTVFKNLRNYIEWTDGSRTTVTLRPAISALTIGYYFTVLDFCMKNKVIVKSLLCTNPRYLSAEILPQEIKKLYLGRYQKFYHDNNLDTVNADLDFNESDPNQLPRIIKSQVLQIMNLLSTDTPADSEQQLYRMVEWCRRWDREYHLDARTLYPEFADILDKHGYHL